MKPNRGQQILAEAVRQHVAVDWDDHRLDLALVQLHGARRRRQRRRAVVVVSLTLCAMLGGLGLWTRYYGASPPDSHQTQANQTQANQPQANQTQIAGRGMGRTLVVPVDPPDPAAIQKRGATLHLADGSKVRPRSVRAKVVVSRVDAGQIEVALERGGARFEVTRRPERVFRVVVGAVEVAVLGTEFTVDRGDERVRVAVQRGQVRVSGPHGRHVLATGDEQSFPMQPEAAAEPEALVDAEASVDHESSTNGDRGRRPARGRWRAFALQGKYRRAFDAMQQEARQRRRGLDHLVRDETRDLFLAADSARLSGHPAKAVPFLRRILRNHGDDARADLAAFTLGRVLLASQRPAEAAGAFGRASELGGVDGALSEDALARQVESWARAERWNRASKAAQRYLKTYPQGRRAAAVRRYGDMATRQLGGDEDG